MSKFCVGCGIVTDTDFIVCDDCSFTNDVATSFVPATCGDDDCYLLPNGEINLDGVDCSHADNFHSVFAN